MFLSNYKDLHLSAVQNSKVQLHSLHLEYHRPLGHAVGNTSDRERGTPANIII
jgi:hypothetical protein